MLVIWLLMDMVQKAIYETGNWALHQGSDGVIASKSWTRNP